jgi:predicted hotdog family 3-hydroxylacyl-ACP dehydratase
MIIGKTNKTAVPAGLRSRLSRSQFASLIPHSGRMCLIDSVEFWDDGSIDCLSGTHRDRSNPLRRNGELSVVHLLEYGAQAMAIHGGLLNGRAAPGMLAALRNVRLYIETAESLGALLRITAFTQAGVPNIAIYDFEVAEIDGRVLVEASATVVNR